MAKKQPEKEPEKSQDQTTKEMKSKDQEKEKKPPFKDLLSKGKEADSSPESSLPGSEDEFLINENIAEVCVEIIAIPFAIWHEINKNVQPLSEKEKENISKPLAKVVAKYDLGKYMKEDFVLLFYLGSAVYGRTKIKKDDKDDNREEGQGKDEPHAPNN